MVPGTISVFEKIMGDQLKIFSTKVLLLRWAFGAIKLTIFDAIRCLPSGPTDCQISLDPRFYTGQRSLALTSYGWLDDARVMVHGTVDTQLLEVWHKRLGHLNQDAILNFPRCPLVLHWRSQQSDS